MLGHLNRARRYFSERTPMRALPELRVAYEEYATFVTEHPGSPEARLMGRQFRGALAQAMTACRTASDSVAGAGQPMVIPCDNIERMAMTALRSTESGEPIAVPRPGRRPLRADPKP